MKLMKNRQKIIKTGGENRDKLRFLGMVGAIHRSGVMLKHF
jgi:hypothetical protein